MPEEPAGETTREPDIYRQYAKALLVMNEFYYDQNDAGMNFTFPIAQKELSVLGGICNNYLLKKVENSDNETDMITREEITSLIERQRTLVQTRIIKTMDYDNLKTEGMTIILEYDRLNIKTGVCK